MVFSKSYCPYCDRAKAALKQMGVDFKTLELDEVSEGGEIQGYLGQLTNQRTVPNIFVRGSLNFTGFRRCWEFMFDSALC